MKQSLSLAGVALAATTVLIWGSQLPIAKASFVAVDPLTITVIRYIVAAAILVPVLAWREGQASLRWGDRAGVAWSAGLLGMTGSPMLVFLGLKFTRPEVAAVIIALQPAMTALVQRAVFGRQVSRFTLGCIVLAFLGVVTVATRWSIALAPHGMELLGDAMVLIGSLCWVFYTMAAERFAGWSNLRLTTMTIVPGAVGGTAVWAVGLAAGWMTLPTTDQWWSVRWEMSFLALFGVLGAMLLWNSATRRLGAINAVLFINMMPVVTFALRFLQGHRFLTIELVGAAMVVSALIANNLHLRHVLNRAAPATAT